MGMWSRTKSIFSPRPSEKVGAVVSARYDAAQSTDLNERHWALTDSASPNLSVSASVRRVLRNRSRYETKNNSYLCGMLNSKTNYVIGRGPRLQMQLSDKASAAQIERAWSAWRRARRINDKLRTAYTAYQRDGEVFLSYATDRNIDRTPVTLTIRIYEADQVADPIWNGYEPDDEKRVDGINLDRNGEAKAYHILKQHPGGNGAGFMGLAGRWVSAKQMLHLYREDRPGQRRGIPHITPSLPLFAILRRFTLAALTSAENVANIGAVVHSDMSADTQDVAKIENFLEIPVVRNMLVTLPFGWRMTQMKAEQPAENFVEFHNQVLAEAARCLDLPKNIALADSSDHNYASGRLDHQIFNQAVSIEQERVTDEWLEPIFEHFLAEYLATTSGISPRDISLDEYPRVWTFDAMPHVDPQKAMEADIGYWDRGLLTDDEFLMRQKLDPEAHYRQLEEMMERREAIGAPVPGRFEQSVVESANEQEEEAQETAVE